MRYNSNREFQMWIYTVSHSMLILRSIYNEDTDVNGYNIDVEFWGVSFVQFPCSVFGLKMQIVVSDPPETIDKAALKKNQIVFEISSREQKYYIVAEGCIVGKNKWTNQNRVLNSYLDYDEILVRS